MSVLDYTYFDNNATVPMFSKAIESFKEVSYCGNTSSANPVAEIWRSRANDFEYILRESFAAPEDSHELIWTSGSTESNCTVVNMFSVNTKMKHIIISTEIEHKCLLGAIEQAKESVDTILLPVRSDGTVDPITVTNMLILLNNTHPGVPLLLCIMHANNETGAINDLYSISMAIEPFRQDREIFFYSDCAQTVGKESVMLSYIDHRALEQLPSGQLYVRIQSPDHEDKCKYIKTDRRQLQDYAYQGTIQAVIKTAQSELIAVTIPTKIVLDGICFSGHKIGGPTGIGALIISRRFLEHRSFIPITGAQNYGLRGGTYNMSGIIGMREAFMQTVIFHDKIKGLCSAGKRYVLQSVKNSGIPIVKYTDYLLGNQPAKCLVYFETDDPDMTLSSTLYCSIVYTSCDRQVCNLKLKNFFEDRKIILSVGSACNSASSKMSHVLKAMLCPKVVALGILRISGFLNPSSDYRKLSSAIIEAFNHLDGLCIARKN